MESPARRSIVDRMKGAAMLDVATYEEVEADTTATGQAATVVAIVAVCAAIGGARGGGGGVIAGLIGAVLGWLVWSGVTYLIGDKLLGGTATWGELLRTIGFAQAPGVLYILGIVPILGGLVRLAVFIWILAAGIIAIRQALDFSTGKAIATALLGWIAVVIIMSVFGMMFGVASIL
ncbi:MAG: YIP1 family protein [Gemmatimonadota bacterium]|nr:YIP1 family protein [Gemmatimonadota bacterium]